MFLTCRLGGWISRSCVGLGLRRRLLVVVVTLRRTIRLVLRSSEFIAWSERVRFIMTDSGTEYIPSDGTVTVDVDSCAWNSA